MADLIDRAALLEAMKRVYRDSTCPMHIAAEIDQYITEAPAVDAVSVVRCKDCKYWMYKYDDVGLCVADVPDIDGVERTALNYCSIGERIGDDEKRCL